MYQAIKDSAAVLRTTDGAHIPSDPGNADWRAYQSWRLAGNAPDPEPESAPEQVQAQYIAALDAHFDATARARGYDSRITCAVRAGYAGPFQAEGLAFAGWMDACYQQGRLALAAVLAGQRAMPTPEAFIGELPAMVWPEAAP